MWATRTKAFVGPGTTSYEPWGSPTFTPTKGRIIIGRMNSRGTVGNTSTKYSARDAETVRSLDNWRPGKGTGMLKKKLLDPPPTERLWLDLPPSEAVQRKARVDAKMAKSNLKSSPVKRNRRDEVYEQKKAARERKARKEPVFTFGIEIPQESRSAGKEGITSEAGEMPISNKSIIRKITSRSSRKHATGKPSLSSTKKPTFIADAKNKKSLRGIKNSLVDKLYQQSSSLRNVFRKFDVDGSGELSRDEFRQAVAKLGFDPNSKEVDEILNVVDSDGNDNIDLAEFAAGFQGEDMDENLDHEAKRRQDSKYKHAAQKSSLGIHMGVRDGSKTIESDQKKKKVKGDRNKSIIVPLVKQRKELSDKNWELLKIQKKILSRLYERTGDNNGRARKILNAFRHCIPNEFGCINRDQFFNRFGVLFGLSKKESNRMFQVGDKRDTGEIDYGRFRKLFDPVDLNEDALKPPNFRPGKKYDMEIDHSGTLRLVGGSAMEKSEHDRIVGMPKGEREKYLTRMRIRKLLDARRHELEPKFIALTENNKEAKRSTKLSYEQCVETIKSLGVNTTGLDANVLRDMYKGYAGPDGITFSEFFNGSRRYFENLGHSKEEQEQQKNYLKLHDIYGRKLGRRRVGSHACAGKAYLSQPGFLAHDDGRLGLAKVSPEKISPIKRREAEREQDQERRNFELKNGTLKPHEEIPAGTSTKWDTYQLVTGVDNVDKVMRYKDRSSETGRSEKDQVRLGNNSKIKGTETLYDQNFANDPLSNNWKTRWLDKNLEGRKYKRNFLSQSGYYSKLTDPSNMFSLIQTDGEGHGKYTSRRRNDYGSHVNKNYEVPTRRNDKYIQTARGGWYKLASNGDETEREGNSTYRETRRDFRQGGRRPRKKQTESLPNLHAMRSTLVTPYGLDY